MKLSCGVPPSSHTLDHARLAEELGYERLWLYDSPALYEDVWIRLAQVAQGTDEIRLGTAVLVPHTRHVMVTASAIATIEDISADRTAYAFGTGASARWLFGDSALPWAYVRDYLQTLRSLLSGETVEVDGAMTRMAHWPGMTVDRPIDVPLIVSALGPKGQGIAAEIADGLMTMAAGVPGWAWQIGMVSGTVLDSGETPDSDRVKEAVGAWSMIMHHATWEGSPEVAASLPGGADWLARIESESTEVDRHLVVHDGHATHLTDRDRPVLDEFPDLVNSMSWVGDAAAIREKAAETATTGVTELLYTPAGPDIERELRAFAAAFA